MTPQKEKFGAILLGERGQTYSTDVNKRDIRGETGSIKKGPLGQMQALYRRKVFNQFHPTPSV